MYNFLQKSEQYPNYIEISYFFNFNRKFLKITT